MIILRSRWEGRKKGKKPFFFCSKSRGITSRRFHPLQRRGEEKGKPNPHFSVLRRKRKSKHMVRISVPTLLENSREGLPSTRKKRGEEREAARSFSSCGKGGRKGTSRHHRNRFDNDVAKRCKRGFIFSMKWEGKKAVPFHRVWECYNRCSRT